MTAIMYGTYDDSFIASYYYSLVRDIDCTYFLPHIIFLNRIQAMAPDEGPPFWGANYKGTYLPQNRVHSPRLEGERYSL